KVDGIGLRDDRCDRIVPGDQGLIRATGTVPLLRVRPCPWRRHVYVRWRRRDFRTASPSLQTRLLQHVDTTGRTEADHVGQADLGALDLTITGFTAKVRGHFVD